MRPLRIPNSTTEAWRRPVYSKHTLLCKANCLAGSASSPVWFSLHGALERNRTSASVVPRPCADHTNATRAWSLVSVLSRASRRYEGRVGTGPRGMAAYRARNPLCSAGLTCGFLGPGQDGGGSRNRTDHNEPYEGPQPTRALRSRDGAPWRNRTADYLWVAATALVHLGTRRMVVPPGVEPGPRGLHARVHPFTPKNHVGITYPNQGSNL